MIDLTNISRIDVYKPEYLQLQYDLNELNRKLPKFNWLEDNEYTGTLRLDCCNVVNKNIRLYWDADFNIICTVDDFEVAANCSMEETIEELKSYLAEQWITK